jgi:DNA-binding CsgD family transcriptional regulator
MLQITPVERDALQLLADGQTLRDIAGRLGTSESELEAGLTSLFVKMGVGSRAEAISAALRRGLLARARAD